MPDYYLSSEHVCELVRQKTLKTAQESIRQEIADLKAEALDNESSSEEEPDLPAPLR